MYRDKKVGRFKRADFTVAKLATVNSRKTSTLPSWTTRQRRAKTDGTSNSNILLFPKPHTPLPNYTPAQGPHSRRHCKNWRPNYTAAQRKYGRSLNLQHLTPSFTSHSITMIIHLLSMVTGTGRWQSESQTLPEAAGSCCCDRCILWLAPMQN